MTVTMDMIISLFIEVPCGHLWTSAQCRLGRFIQVDFIGLLDNCLHIVEPTPDYTSVKVGLDVLKSCLLKVHISPIGANCCTSCCIFWNTLLTVWLSSASIGWPTSFSAKRPNAAYLSVWLTSLMRHIPDTTRAVLQYLHHVTVGSWKLLFILPAISMAVK